ncbi:hypothetical protein VNG_2387H [Halobacterium salinarum NRC-1]|uniref:Spurious ORF n=1 Tax=Halobacterium salinarum (strain ATCC 700922 / JCM 11081 / NRC-1) TaxID=64091 RepID=Q9HMU0_HALSA|nr:hypothetical protein VNG_2387H [Halobacterium salinarum NRC-1]DAC79238.1 TPA_inf: spurious ORF [Halobacterium salinarum NRC-1]
MASNADATVAACSAAAAVPSLPSVGSRIVSYTSDTSSSHQEQRHGDDCEQGANALFDGFSVQRGGDIRRDLAAGDGRRDRPHDHVPRRRREVDGVPADQPAAEDVDERRDDGSACDHDVVRADGDPHGDLRGQHRDDAEFADTEPGQPLEGAADAVVPEPPEVAAAVVLVGVAVAVNPGDRAVVDAHARRAELVGVVGQVRPAVGGRRVAVVAVGGVAVAEVCLEQEQ